jgi:uncharacterized repeat protein (TIGR01451 family)
MRPSSDPIFRLRISRCWPVLLLGLCSCASVTSTVTSDPFIDETLETTAGVAVATVASLAPTHNSYTQPAAPILPVAAEAIVVVPNVERAVSFTPASPRIELAGEVRMVAADVETNEGAFAERHDDEYLFDGGDRALPIHYDEFTRQGVDTEDTIAEFVDHRGGRHVKPTNRVAIYAPRFGAIASLGGVNENVRVAAPSGSSDLVRSVGVQTKTTTTLHQTRDATAGMRMRSRVSGLDSEQYGVGYEQRMKLAIQDKLQNLYQASRFLKSGKFENSEKPWLAAAQRSAVAWSRDAQPIVVGTLEGGQEMQASFRASELVGLEEEELPDGELRIVKLADKKIAQPGDVITFTIRYDNLGGRPLHHIRIIDNLTPRLVYIDQSADSDRDGRLVVEDNEEGSLVLKFEIAEPLPGKTGGVVTFKARVR